MKGAAVPTWVIIVMINHIPDHIGWPLEAITILVITLPDPLSSDHRTGV